MVSASYAAAPVILVGLVAPGVLPAYAILDKVQRQISAGATSYVTVLQGWVPEARGRVLHSRIRAALKLSVVVCLLLGVLLALLADRLLDYLARGQIVPSPLAVSLMAATVAVALFESVVSRACLSSLDRLDVVARATVIGSLVGVLVLVVGVLVQGVEGALAGVLTGLVLRLLIGLSAVVREGRAASSDNR